MKRATFNLFIGCVVVAAGASASQRSACGQTTTINGGSLTMRSVGSAGASSSWVLNNNGFVGTYITLPSAGTVDFTIQASGVADGGAAPRMNLVVDDSKTGWDVGSAAAGYTTSLSLPAGTHFVRTEFANDVASLNRTLTVQNLQVNGATVVNSNNATIALAASDTYIQNFRKGPVTISLSGPGNIPLLPGTQVNADLKRIAFNFGTAVPGTSANGVGSYLGNSSTAQQTNYQAKLNQNFNSVVPENIGKWGSNEASRNVVTMGGVDTILNYAQSHGMTARMHNLIWGSQQPGWATTLLSQAAAGSMTSQTDLRSGITSRINYYVGTGTASDRSKKYTDLDIYNESYHTGSTVAGSYWNVYTPTGIADIYRQIHAVAPNVKLYVNEYNIYADTNDGSKYATYYMTHLQQLRQAAIDAGYGDVLGGIGTQYYVNNSIANTDPNAVGASNSAHNPARLMQTMQNLAVTGLPVTLTEFGVKSGATATTAAQMLSDSLRISFGNADTAGFMMWGFHAENGGGNLFAPAAALYNVSTSNWNSWTITPAGQAWQDLLGIQDWDGNPNNGWSTHVTPTVNPDGTINFTGFWGDYNIGNTGSANLTLVKGTSNYNLQLAAPPSWHLWNAGTSGNLSALGALGVGHTAYFGNAAAPRTVTVDAPTTLGMLAFDSSSSYTIDGTSTLTLEGLAGVAAIYVANGSHTITAPLALNDDLNITVVPPGSVLTIGSDLVAPAQAINKSGAGMVQLKSIHANSLNVNAGQVAISPGGTSNSLHALSIASGAQLDLADNTLNIDDITQGDAIRQHLQAGRLGSSLAGNGKAVGYADNGSNLLVVKLTFAGDSNLDGLVDVTDLGALATNWQSSALWSGGDFNYDGFVDVTDLGTLASNWQAGGGGANFAQALAAVGLSGTSVPEPAIMSLIPLAWLLARRRRR